MGVRDSTERPKLGVSGVKDTAKTNKDLGISCYIQVEYSVFFHWCKKLFSQIFLKLILMFFLNIFDNNFYMVTRELPMEKRHYILPVCDMTCLNLY